MNNNHIWGFLGLAALCAAITGALAAVRVPAPDVLAYLSTTGLAAAAGAAVPAYFRAGSSDAPTAPAAAPAPAVVPAPAPVPALESAPRATASILTGSAAA